jgi:hypothetical protein
MLIRYMKPDIAELSSLSSKQLCEFVRHAAGSSVSSSDIPKLVVLTEGAESK